MLQDVTELREIITNAARNGVINRERFREELVLLLGGSWFGKTYYDEAQNVEVHLLDNYPEQHVKMRQRARDDAVAFMELLGL